MKVDDIKNWVSEARKRPLQTIVLLIFGLVMVVAVSAASNLGSGLWAENNSAAAETVPAMSSESGSISPALEYVSPDPSANNFFERWLEERSAIGPDEEVVYLRSVLSSDPRHFPAARELVKIFLSYPELNSINRLNLMEMLSVCVDAGDNWCKAEMNRLDL